MLNSVELTGEVIKEFEKNDLVKGEQMYSTVLAVPRLFGDKVDKLIIRMSDRFDAFKEIKIGTKIAVKGSIRTRNVVDEGATKRRLEITVFCTSVNIVPEEEYQPVNKVEIEGYLNRPANLRRAKTEDKVLCEQMLVCKRNYNKISFVPSVFWGRDGEYINSLERGSMVHCEGRFQSRDYIKVIDGVSVTKTTYEFVAQSVYLVSPEDN